MNQPQSGPYGYPGAAPSAWPPAPGYPPSPQPGGPAPAAGRLRGLIFGTGAMVALLVLDVVLRVINVSWSLDKYRRSDAWEGLIWIVPTVVVGVLIALAADPRVRSRWIPVGCVVAAVLVDVGATVFSSANNYFGWFYYDTLRGVFLALGFISSALFMAAWLLGRRRSGVVALLALVFAAAWTLYSWLGPSVSWGMDASVAPVVVKLVAYWTIPQVILSVAFAWLGVLLDYLLSSGRQSPAAASPVPGYSMPQSGPPMYWPAQQGLPPEPGYVSRPPGPQSPR